MVHVRQGFFRYRAFWMTAGLSAGAATWVLAIEPIGAPVLLQPVPDSKVVQTQAQSAPPQTLRTQQASGGAVATPTQTGATKSAVQLKLEELYQQDGRQMPDLPDPQIPRQAPAQGTQGGAPSPAPVPGAPASTGVQVRPVSTPSSQPAAQPQNGTWAQAQAAGAPRSTPAKKVTWIEQINPFKKRVSSAPPTEPAEIQYDPRRPAGQVPQQYAQPQQPMQVAQQPSLQPGQVNPQTGRQNYSQLFAQPQTFAAPPTQGDPFVAAPPMAVLPAPQAPAPAIVAVTPPPAAPPVAVAQAPVFVVPVAPQTPSPTATVQSPGTLVPPAALAAASPAPATPVANLPMLDFRTPVPVTTVPTQPSIASTAIPQAQPPAAQVAQLPLVLPQNSPSAAGPQNAVPQSIPAATPTLGDASPFTGLGLNDPPPANTPVAVQAPAGQTVAVVPTQPLQVAALPTPPAPPAAPAVPAAPAPAAVAVGPQPLPKLDGFFSEEEERQTDQPLNAAVPEQPRPAVVSTPPSAAEPPVLELPVPAEAAPLVVVTPSVPVTAPPLVVPAPVDVAAKAPAELPALEFPPIAAAPQPLPVKEVAPSESVPPLQPVPRQADGVAASKMARIAARSDQRGLKGFCPVMLRDHRELVDAKAEHRSFYRNRIILLSSQEAKIVFESDPTKYAPAAAGNDVIHLAQTGEELEGSLEHAVWYKGRLYMFDSAETLETFVAAPSSHATND